MQTSHPHFCSDCGKTYQCRITEPCHLDTAELCLAHYLEREKQEAWRQLIKRPKRPAGPPPAAIKEAS